MSGADLFEDGFPHGTEQGYDDGCRGGSCPAGLEHGLTCKRAKQLSNGDYRYKRLVRQGLTPAQIAAELDEKPHEAHHAPERDHKRRDIDAASPITTTRPMRQPEEPTVPTPTPKDVAKPHPTPSAVATPPKPQPDQATGTEKLAPLTTDKWTAGLNQRDKTGKLGEIRAWARRHGFPGVPTHGKIPQAALAAYDAAHPLPGEPGSGFDRMPGAELSVDGEVVAVADADGVTPAFTVVDEQQADDEVVVTALMPVPVPGGIIPAILAKEAEASIALDGETFVVDGPTTDDTTTGVILVDATTSPLDPSEFDEALHQTKDRVEDIPANWCPNKQRFETADEADRALVRIREKRLLRGATKVEHRSYACPHCDGWHLSSQPLRHTPRELSNNVGEAAEQTFVASKVPSTGMRAWLTTGTRGPAVVREVRSVLDSTYATNIMREVPTGVRVTWLPEDDDARQGLEWLDEVTAILPVSAFKYDQFGSDDMADTLAEWERTGRTWQEAPTDMITVDPSHYPSVESTTPRRPDDKYSLPEKPGTDRPDWADITIPEDIAKARSLAARIEEENAQLLQALADKDTQIAALDEHAADTRRQLALAEHDVDRITRSMTLVLQLWAQAKDEAWLYAGYLEQRNVAIADLIGARSNLREAVERIEDLERQLEVERAVNERFTQLPVAEVIDVRSLRRPWWKRGRA